MKTRVSVIGHFGKGKQLLNGQTIKTKMLTEELEHSLGREQVARYDTSGGWKALFNIPVRLFRAFRHSDNIVILPAYKGVRYIMFLIAAMRPFFKKTGLHYAVVGGWLTSYIDTKHLLAKWLHLLDGIYVETGTMKNAITQRGYSNVILMPNCKDLKPVDPDSETVPDCPLRLCTFSRVMQGKGLAEAAETIRRFNERKGYTAFSLDIYGPVWQADSEWFEQEKESFPDYVRYMGAVPFNGSVEVLKDYFMLLFPTRFFTEGVPGTVIDAYAAGLPVLASRWESYADVIEDGVTGIGFEFDNFDSMESQLEYILNNVAAIVGMKRDCVRKAGEFVPSRVFSILADRLV